MEFTQFLSYVCPGKNYFFGNYMFCKKKFAAIIVTSLRNFYHIFVLERIIFWRLYILQKKEICCHYCHIFVFIFWFVDVVFLITLNKK